jgi:hypothetical protein
MRVSCGGIQYDTLSIANAQLAVCCNHCGERATSSQSHTVHISLLSIIDRCGSQSGVCNALLSLWDFLADRFGGMQVSSRNYVYTILCGIADTCQGYVLRKQLSFRDFVHAILSCTGDIFPRYFYAILSCIGGISLGSAYAIASCKGDVFLGVLYPAFNHHKPGMRLFQFPKKK